MKTIVILLALLLATASVNAQQMDHSSMKNNNKSSDMPTLMKKPKVLELNRAMRNLWYAHMYWTLITVDAYYNDPKGLNAKLNRLL